MRDAKGFTLVELVVFILIGAIVLPATFVAYRVVFNKLVTPDLALKARFYAQTKMEEFTKYPCSSSYPPIVSETAYTDITGSNGIQWKWKIQFVDPSNSFIETAADTGYKAITVTVKTPKEPSMAAVGEGEYAVSRIIASRPK